ncbi:MAG: sulfite exporter TauE/SafE family protein [Myxococcota bacterium]
MSLRELAILATLGAVCWTISTLAAGGGALTFLPASSFVLSPREIPPILATASVASSVQRCWLYRREIETRIVLWNVPGLLLGIALGAFALRDLDPTWLSLLVGGFLVWISLRHFRGGGDLRLSGGAPTFAAASFTAGTLSTVVGASGPIMNPVYLGAGIVKQAMVGTKAASTLVMQLLKIGAFASLGLLAGDLLVAGVAVGLGTLVGNVVGAAALRRISVARFKDAVHAVVLIAGVWMIAKVWLV